jgi:hypothetical protein
MTIVVVAGAVAATTLTAIAAPEGASDQHPAVQGDNPLSYVTADAQPPHPKSGSKVWTAFASCGPHSDVLGGGFDVYTPGKSNPFEGNVIASAPHQNLLNGEYGWSVSAEAKNSDYQPFTAYAVCAPKSLVPGYNLRTATTTIDPQRSGSVAPSCERSNEVVVGGGFSMDPDTNGIPIREIPAGRAYLIRTQPNLESFGTWLVTAYNDYPNGTFTKYKIPVKLRAKVICVPKSTLTNLHYQGAANTGRSGVPTNTPECRSGTYLLGGGAGVPDGNKKRSGATSAPVVVMSRPSFPLALSSMGR